MTTIALLLRPLDVLLFRDARPFGVGDSGRSQLPLPQTFAGLIKTYLTHKFEWSSRDWHGHHSQPEEERPWHARLKFRGPWLFADRLPTTPRGPLVPTPADVICLGKNKDAKLDRLRPLADADAKLLSGWSPPIDTMRPLWLAGQDAPVTASGFLDVNQTRSYLAGEVPTQPHPLDVFAESEQRTGIGIEPDRLTADQEQGLIYSASFWRLQNGVCFYGEIKLPDADARPGPRGEPVPSASDLFPAGLTLPWGGEGRRVCVEPTERVDWGRLQPPSSDSRLLSLLVTPGIFSNGQHRWKPRELGTLIAAAAPKPLPVSGWDLAGGQDNGHRERPRPTRFAVPAGGVYFWQRSEKTMQRDGSAAPAPLTSPCDRPQDRDNGWGLALFGTWKDCDLNEKGSNS
jgi:CRISPR-associated protein Cmr3